MKESKVFFVVVCVNLVADLPLSYAIMYSEKVNTCVALAESFINAGVDAMDLPQNRLLQGIDLSL